MRFFYISIVLIYFNSYTINAQNYSPIVSGNTSLFKTSSFFYAMHVDSVKASGSGTSSFFIKTVNPDYNSQVNDCRPYASMWTGPLIYYTGDSAVFFNQNNDSIFFLPLAPLNATWNLYQFTNGNYLEARISQKEQLTFLGLIDSVKTISLQLKNGIGNTISDPINFLTFTLSQNHGILQATSFINFPTSYPIYEIAGMSSPIVGIQLLTPRQIYNYDIGDEFQYESVQSYPSSSTNSYSTKIILQIINKYTSANTDTLIYAIKKNQERTTYNYQTNTSSVSHEITEISQKIIFSTIYYPGQYIVHEAVYINDGYDNLLYYDMVETDDPYNRLGWTSYNSGELSYNGSCWTNLISDNLETHYNYLEGSGPTLNDNNVGLTVNYSKMVYYKKGDEIWGHPLTLSTYTKKENTSIGLYPNPLKQGEILHIHSENFQVNHVAIYNATGSKMLESNARGSSIESIDLSALQPGLYMVQLLNERNEFTTSKIIIK